MFPAPERVYRWRRRLSQTWEQERLYHHNKHLIGTLKSYTLEHANPSSLSSSSDSPPKPRLAVMGGYPFFAYLALGYDWLAPYYNPHMMFEEVHYIQCAPTRHRKVDVGYPLHVHGCSNNTESKKVCKRFGVQIIRAYDPCYGQLATEVAQQLGIPVVVSVH